MTMKLPTKAAPKLADIDPDKLAQAVVDSFASELEDALSWAGQPRSVGRTPRAGSPLAVTVAELARYAQSGAQPRSVGRTLSEANASEVVRSLTFAPLLRFTLSRGVAPEPDTSTPLGLVVACALAREALERGKPISTTRLALLGGVTPGRVRQLVISEDLATNPASEVRAKDAIAWLASRGVPGFTK